MNSITKELDRLIMKDNSGSVSRLGFVAKIPFRPLNGFLWITRDTGSADPARGMVLAACLTLKGQIFPGDFVMYRPGADLVPLTFGKADGVLISVRDLYGVWDAEALREIDRETQGRPGVGGRALTFDIERGE